MKRLRFKFPLFLLSILVFTCQASMAQVRSQEISEDDGLPVLLKHLPDYDNVRSVAAFTTSKDELARTVGAESVLNVLDFTPGTEAVTAPYPQGRLVIVEYTSPQMSIDVDGKVQQHIATNPQSQFAYRRIGNYNAFVFGVSDSEGANSLLDEIKYQKTVQWLGEDPYILKRLERYMVTTSRDVMISTVIVIILWIITALLAGVVAGLIFFRVRDSKRATRSAYSDAGGLTRLNLDGLSE